MTVTEILAVIGGITLILTAAVRIPAALAEFLRACILVADAARDLRAALARHSPRDVPTPSDPGPGRKRPQAFSADDCGKGRTLWKPASQPPVRTPWSTIRAWWMPHNLSGPDRD
jgi:hypothetical protein